MVGRQGDEILGHSRKGRRRFAAAIVARCISNLHFSFYLIAWVLNGIDRDQARGCDAAA